MAAHRDWDWDDRVDRLRYDGEAEQRRLELETATIVVTSHRVLAFGRTERTASGARPYRHVDRPNVQRVGVSRSGPTNHLLRGLLAGAFGLTLLTVAAVVSFADLLPDLELDGAAAADGEVDGSDAGTTAAVDGTFDTLGALFQVLDLSILVGALVSLAVAAVCAGLYARSRSRRLVLEVAGADDIEVPLGETDDAGPITLSLSEAIQPGPTTGAPESTGEDGRPGDRGDSRRGGERWRTGGENECGRGFGRGRGRGRDESG